MPCSRRNSGMTLIEVAIVTMVIGALMSVSFVSMREWQDNERASAAARGAADLLRVAATEAVRTGSIHIVFLSISGSGDVLGGDLGDWDGDWVPLLVLDDGAPGSANQNCQIDSGENIHFLPATDGVGWGSSLAGGSPGHGSLPGSQLCRERIGAVRRNHKHHADARIERAQHFRLGNAACITQPGKDPRQRPCSQIYLGAQPLRQDARQIFCQAPARNVGKPMHTASSDGRQRGAHIEPRGR